MYWGERDRFPENVRDDRRDDVARRIVRPPPVGARVRHMAHMALLTTHSAEQSYAESGRNTAGMCRRVRGNCSVRVHTA